MGDVWSNRGVSPFRENCVIQAKLPGQSRFSRMAEEDSRGLSGRLSGMSCDRHVQSSNPV